MKKQSQLVAVWVSLVLACGVAAAGEVGTSKSYHGPTGLQLYSLRDMQSAQGVEAALDKAVALGFKYVEVAALGKFSPAEFKEQLDRRGLIPIGRHFPFDQLRDNVEGVARDAKVLGIPYVGCAWIPHKDPFTPEQCREAARVFNRAGAALAKHGIKFYYHNHGYEFQPYGQGTLFDLLASETDPKTVFFQMDVLWTVLPGQDPVQLIEKYPSRWLLMHLKDLKKGVPTGSLSGGTALTNDVALGSGQVQWPALFRAAQKAGIKYYFIEDESPAVLQQIPRSLQFLESLEW
ncbi:MAG: sugar phosphate isomerase/epimerase [Thermoguttaceae bacterium]|jgi:sugar phosphate isomerase/epimerase